jgi:hypothetical protein
VRGSSRFDEYTLLLRSWRYLLNHSIELKAETSWVHSLLIDFVQRLQHPTFGTDNTIRSIVDSDFRDEDFAICPASIIVFSLDNHKWCSVSIAKLGLKEWRPATFDRLVLDHEKKDTLPRIAKTNS